VPGAPVALAERLQGLCLGRGITVAVAESCTGGLVAATITEVPGSSGYFLGGVVSYANTAKEALLDVPATMLAAHGAVSAQVAMAMAI
jgi:nicotinamide-nucleotide amidase